MSSRSAIYGSIAASIAFVMELTLVPLLLPVIQTQLDLSIGDLAWVFNSYGVAVAAGVLVGGLLGDAFNAKRIFSIGVFFFAVGSAVVAWVDGFELMLVGRILQGFGGGVFSPLVPILLTKASPRRPGRILIVWGSIAGYAAAFAPILYSHFFANADWNLAFVILAVVAIGALIIVNQSPIRIERLLRPRAKPDYPALFQSPGLWVMFGYVFCTYGCITYYLFRVPIRLAEYDFQVVSIGFALSIMWFSFAVVSTLLRNMVDKPFVRSVLLAAPVLIVAGFQLAFFCHDLVCLTLSAMLVGSGLACSNAPSTQLILKMAPKGTSALSASIDITFARIGGVVTVSVLANTMFGYAVVAITILSIVAMLCALAAFRHIDKPSAKNKEIASP